MLKTNFKFMYIVITLLVSIILIQVLQICTFRPKDFIENFEEEVQSLSKSELKLMNHKLSQILEKVNCIPNCNKNTKLQSNNNTEVNKVAKINKVNKVNKKVETKPEGIPFTEDDNDESVNEEQNELDENNVEGFIDGLSHNCSQV